MTISVLLADDHVVVRDGLKMLLEAQGDMTVVGVAADGEEAMRQARALCPNVAVMDIAMPGMNGIDAARLIRTECPSTQVVMLSIHGTAEHIYRALQAGALGYLLKESAGAEVAAAIREVFAGHRYLSRKIADAVVSNYINDKPGSDPLSELSARERQVLQLIVEGSSSQEVAKKLDLSPKTVETYRSRIMKKLGLKDLTALVKFAIQHNLIPLE